MAIDKTIDYVVQDGYENYTKNSDSVTVPRKFKSRKNATPTKLAYITADEAKMLKKMKKGTPHKGPSGVPSYDDFDAQGKYSSGAAMSAAETGGSTDRDRRDMAQAGISPQEAQALRTAAINAGAGQRVNPGFFDSRTNLTPAEIRAAKKARRHPNNLYGAKSFKNTGQSGIMNMIKSGGILGSLFRILGQKLGLGKKSGEATYDMSEFNNLGLLSDRINPDYYNDLDNELMLSTQKTPTQTFSFDNSGMKTKPIFSDSFANTVGTTANTINDSVPQGINTIDVGYPSNDLMAGLTEMQQKMLVGPQKNLRNIMGISDQEILNNISPFNNPEDPATLEEVQTFYGADGGLASMFTRRG